MGSIIKLLLLIHLSVMGCGYPYLKDHSSVASGIASMIPEDINQEAIRSSTIWVVIFEWLSALSIYIHDVTQQDQDQAHAHRFTDVENRK